MLTMVGKIYAIAPVTSNIITVIETVRCIMPLNAAPAPRKAYVPGVMQGTSGSQDAKKAESGKASYRASTRMPTALPKEAPIAIEGTKIPAGTLHPYEMMTRSVRRTVAPDREKRTDHRFSDLG